MTLNEFLKALEQAPREWEVNNWGQIRTPGHTCPIVAVAGDTGARAWSCGKQLGLRENTIDRIVDAADDTATSQTHLRRRLLKACGLEADA